MAKTYTQIEGELTPDRAWIAKANSPFRSLTSLEVLDLAAMAETATPVFGGDGNATWEQTHPIARDIYERRGLKPKV